MSLRKYILENTLNIIDSKFKDPDYLYHLTDSGNIDSIKKGGLRIDHSKQHKFEPGIYLTNDIYVALNYSYLDELKEEFFIIEIPFGNLNKKNMKPDDYEVFDILEDEFISYEKLLNELGIYDEREIHQNQKFIYNTLNYRHSLYISNQILYTDNILPNNFSNIYNESEAERKIGL